MYVQAALIRFSRLYIAATITKKAKKPRGGGEKLEKKEGKVENDVNTTFI